MSTEFIVERLSKSHLAELSLDPENLLLKLTFSFEPSEEVCIVKCSKVIHFSFSKDPEDEEAAYFIVDAFLNLVKDGGRFVLETLGFPWKDKEGRAVVDEEQAYHFYTIGDVCLNIVCHELTIVDNPDNEIGSAKRRP